MDQKRVDEALKLFNVFRIKKKVDVTKLEDTKWKLFSVYNDDDDVESLNSDQIRKELETSLMKQNKDFMLYQDPRNAAIGFRLIVKENGWYQPLSRVCFFFFFDFCGFVLTNTYGLLYL